MYWKILFNNNKKYFPITSKILTQENFNQIVIPIINDEKILNILDKIEIDAIDNLKNTVTKSDYFIIDLNKKKKNITLSVI